MVSISAQPTIIIREDCSKMYKTDEMTMYLRAVDDMKPNISKLEAELRRRKAIIQICVKCFDNLYKHDIPEWLLSDIEAVCAIARTTVLDEDN